MPDATKLEREKKLRYGFTTGASAAGAAKAAALLLFRGIMSEMVTVENPQGIKIEIPIKDLYVDKDGCAKAVVVKDGGDDPDVTDGLDICVTLYAVKQGFIIQGGEGVGVVTLPGLAVPVGQPAINPIPQKMIREAVSPLLPENSGVKIIISIPEGAETAKKTLNSRLGIIGGVSVLGTTGIVRPMSMEALKDSLEPFIKKAAALGYKSLVLTPGGSGYRQAVNEYGFNSDVVVETSNYIGFMLEKCVENQIKSVILWGQIGKITKIAGGIFNTHNRVADGRREIMAAHAALQGASKEMIADILNINTLENALNKLRKSGMQRVVDSIAASAGKKAEEFTWGKLKVGTVIVAKNGEIISANKTALELGRQMLCRELK